MEKVTTPITAISVTHTISDGSGTYGIGGLVDSLDELGTDEVASDVVLLRRVWQNEKCAPEILPYEASLVERVREQIQLMIERHPIHIIDNQELWDRLSEYEQEYTNKYCEVLAKHFEQTVLIRLPEQYGSMLTQTSLASEENDMSIPKHNFKIRHTYFCFAECLAIHSLLLNEEKILFLEELLFFV
ncbi:hypothetical protein R1flu_025471 [Riccia fluitans]|uniref:Uncharacterized protein n=1 Tax=Riccia fluitans TaxID=41844 RepID=A0ABD1XXW3_9MARC